MTYLSNSCKFARAILAFEDEVHGAECVGLLLTGLSCWQSWMSLFFGGGGGLSSHESMHLNLSKIVAQVLGKHSTQIEPLT